MNEEDAGRRIVLTSLPLTALFTAAVITGKLLKTHQQPRWILFVWILPAVILLGYMILSAMMQYPANSKRFSMNTTARQLLTAANASLEDMQKTGSHVPESPYIIQIGDTPEPDSLADRITYYFSDAAKIKSYALILRRTDDGVRAAEAFYSFDTDLTPDTLTETPEDVQLSQLGRLYRQKPLIFRYTAAQALADSKP